MWVGIEQRLHSRLIGREAKTEYLYYCDRCRVTYVPLKKQGLIIQRQVDEVRESNDFSYGLRHHLVYGKENMISKLYRELTDSPRGSVWHEEAI